MGMPTGGNSKWAVGRFEAFGTVPEPNTALLMGLGLVELGVRRRDYLHNDSHGTLSPSPSIPVSPHVAR
jgi:hypothetical protein